MNIYLFIEDGESFCIKAKTMCEAVGICERSYLEDRRMEQRQMYDMKAEKEYYHEQILKSCSLVGGLKKSITKRDGSQPPQFKDITMTQKEIEYAVAKNLIKSLSLICAANPEKIIDLLTGYLWDEEEAGDVKRSSGDFVI